MFAEKLSQLKEEMYSTLLDLLETKGGESERENTSNNVIDVEALGDDFCFNLDGGRYLVELDANYLYDNEGYTYNHDVLPIEEMIQIIDKVREL